MKPGTVWEIRGRAFSGLALLGAVMPMARIAPREIKPLNEGMVPKIAWIWPDYLSSKVSRTIKVITAATAMSAAMNTLLVAQPNHSTAAAPNIVPRVPPTK